MKICRTGVSESCTVPIIRMHLLLFKLETASFNAMRRHFWHNNCCSDHSVAYKAGVFMCYKNRIEFFMENLFVLKFHK